VSARVLNRLEQLLLCVEAVELCCARLTLADEFRCCCLQAKGHAGPHKAAIGGAGVCTWFDFLPPDAVTRS
jgi:hypothetical protein